MARKRTGEIVESVEELERLEKEHRGKPAAARIRVFRLLKEDPALTIEDAAIAVGYSKQAVKRWLKMYRAGGLHMALLPKGRGSQNGGERELDMLRRRLDSGAFSSIIEVIDWCQSLSVSDDLARGGDQLQSPRFDEEQFVQNLTPLKDEKILQFLSKLPDVFELAKVVDVSRSALREFLGDVDLISIGINLESAFDRPVGKVNIALSQFSVSGVSSAVTSQVDGDQDDDAHVERLLCGLRERKFPIEKYHKPISFVYYINHGSYLGAIVLWRERSKANVSPQTVAIMQRLESFFRFLLSDFLARYRAAHPVDNVVFDLISDVVKEYSLTNREHRVMILILLGMSYDEMASALNLSVNTVRGYLRSLYEKTGVNGRNDLVAKFFSPKLASR